MNFFSDVKNWWTFRNFKRVFSVNVVNTAKEYQNIKIKNSFNYRTCLTYILSMQKVILINENEGKNVIKIRDPVRDM